MDAKKLTSEFKKHKVAFRACVECRMRTSVFNKDLHELMLEYINNDDWTTVYELVASNVYRKPLEGVVYCIELDFDDKEVIVNLFEGRT